MSRAAFCSLLLLAVSTAGAAGLPPFAPGTPPFGKGGSPARPGFAILRADEDWRFLADPAVPRLPFDRWKHLPLDKAGRTVLTLGLDLRLGAENYWDENWGAPAGSDFVFDVRINPHASLRLGDRLRVYSALKYGELHGRDGFVPPVERSDPNIHQAFVELGVGDWFGLPAAHDLLVRAGRMELHFGDGNIVSIRNGPNVREDHDGLLLRARLGRTVIDAFATYTVEDEFDAFANQTVTDEGVWGIYSSTAFRGPGTVVDFADAYYIGYDRNRSFFYTTGGFVSETRHTAGVRFGRRPSRQATSWGIEAALQWGTACPANGPLDIFAWSISGRYSTPLPGDLPGSPLAGLRFGATSGDRDPRDGDLNTFRVPIPRGEYFGNTTPFGPGNIAGFELYLDFQPSPRLNLHPYWQPFWRTDPADGLYSPGSTPVRPGRGDAHFIGQEAGLEVSYTLNRNQQLGLNFGHFFPARFIRDNPPDKPITYLRLQWDLQL